MKIIIDNWLSNRCAGDVHHPCPRKAQQKEQAEHTLFVMVYPCYSCHHLTVEGDAWDNNDGARRGGIVENLCESCFESFLKRAHTADFRSLKATTTLVSSGYFAQILFLLKLPILNSR